MAKKIVVWIILIIVLAVTIFLIINNISKSNPQYVAHQGYSSKYPGNTALSFTKAAEMPFDGIETDIKQTSDGLFVCNHDNTVVYNDGTKLKISTSTYAELKAKPLKNDKTDDEVYLCGFDEYLDICKNGGKIAVIELKEDFSDEKVAKAFEIIDAHYDRSKCLFIAFDFDSICRVHSYDGNVEVQYLSKTINDENIEKCLNLGISLDIQFALCTEILVKKFHAKGLKVNVWTVDSKIVKEFLRRMKVDYITTNKLYEN